KEGFVFLVTVAVKKPGAYQLRAALRDHGSERVGSASQFVQVPDVKKNRLTLSGVIAVGEAAEPKQRKAVVAASQPGDQTGEGEETRDPTNSAAVRQFHNGSILQYGFAIYNAHFDKATGQPQLLVQSRLFRDGSPIFTGKEQPFTLNNPPDLKRLAVN